MKHLVVHNLGHPFVADNLVFTQNAYIEAFRALCRSMAADVTKPYLVTGLSVTIAGPNLVVSEGWVFVNDNLIRIPAITIPNTHPYLFFAFTVSYGSPVVYLNNVTWFDVYQDRGAQAVTVPVDTNPPSVGFYYKDLQPIGTGLVKYISPVGGVAPSFNPVWQSSTAYAIEEPVGYRITGDGRVALCGVLETTAAGWGLANTLAFTLPPGVHPLFGKIFSIHNQFGTAHTVKIDIDGNVYVHDTSGAFVAGSLLPLDGISFERKVEFA